jgi:hypothetical protein
LYDLKERGGEEKAEVMRYDSLQAVQLPLLQLTSNQTIFYFKRNKYFLTRQTGIEHGTGTGTRFIILKISYKITSRSR